MPTLEYGRHVLYKRKLSVVIKDLTNTRFVVVKVLKSENLSPILVERQYISPLSEPNEILKEILNV